ncbi:helix-turn-helix domain-containing protein [Novosphingobium ovatum]|uniref:helix-turn-helix domain-containing protein n=1 Tax=Novosphingobium ovatum TaxID=1908523 RepID=UPI00191C1BA4|nr:helix-turn-helix domain-containing protein [Novosphingobium ovatum]
MAPYFTTFYLAEIDPPEGGSVSDFLHPEWGNLRFVDGPGLRACNHAGQTVEDVRFVATGPSTRALRFAVPRCRIWGVGLLPLGWARFVGHRAADLADGVVDGHDHSAFARFAPLADSLFGATPDPQAEYARIAAHFLAQPAVPKLDVTRITAIHAALVDPAVARVEQLADRVGASSRTIERICAHAFGFSPKQLLRRQRFMRSLSQYMLDPSLKWVGALDGHYHDQAQFVREFNAFMGMSPRQYARQPHPILDAFVSERARLQGSAVQTLDPPR